MASRTDFHAKIILSLNQPYPTGNQTLIHTMIESSVSERLPQVQWGNQWMDQDHDALTHALYFVDVLHLHNL